MHNLQEFTIFVPMKEIDELKKEIFLRGMMCQQYDEKWQESMSKKQLFDMAVSVQGSDTLCQSIAEGWGLQPEFISDKFRAYINDRYLSEQDGYTSKMYCGHDADMVVEATLNVIINSCGNVFVPRNHVCEIRLVNSNIKILGDGYCNVIKYGDCQLECDNARIHIKNGV